MRFSLLLVLSVLGVCACNPSVCTRNSDCAHGLICGEEDTCVLPPDLAKVPDGGSEDASTDLSVADDLKPHDDLESFDGSTQD